MTFSKYLLLCLSASTLAACQTADGFVADIADTFNLSGNSSPYAISDVEVAKTKDPCPQVKIVDELSSLSEFASPGNTSEPNLISRVNLQQVESTCSFQNDQVSVDLKMAFESTLGAKGRLRSSDKPFFSYPFFVAVTDPQGIIMAKEVFSASMTYEKGEESHVYFETMRQLIPLDREENAKRHQVLLGFQLDPAQLKYNRANMITVPAEPAPIGIAPPLQNHQSY